VWIGSQECTGISLVSHAQLTCLMPPSRSQAADITGMDRCENMPLCLHMCCFWFFSVTNQQLAVRKPGLVSRVYFRSVIFVQFCVISHCAPRRHGHAWTTCLTARSIRACSHLYWFVEHVRVSFVASAPIVISCFCLSDWGDGEQVKMNCWHGFDFGNFCFVGPTFTTCKLRKDGASVPTCAQGDGASLTSVTDWIIILEVRFGFGAWSSLFFTFEVCLAFAFRYSWVALFSCA
jgi:hypothetical protein